MYPLKRGSSDLICFPTFSTHRYFHGNVFCIEPASANKFIYLIVLRGRSVLIGLIPAVVFSVMNHRPTLEGKRGYEKSIKDTIQHARLLKSHTKLKYRLDVLSEDVSNGEKRHKAGPTSDGESLESKLQAAIDKSGDKEGQIDEAKSQALPDLRHKSEMEPKADNNGNGDKETEQLDTLLENKNKAEEDADDDGSSASNTDDSGSDEESESDSEALQAELDALRKEKELEKMAENAKTAPLKKSWRSTRPFAKKDSKAADQYTVNTVKSSTHKQFMSKYIR